MADGPMKEEAQRLVDLLRVDMQALQVQAEQYRKQNAEYAEVLAEKEERALELMAEEREALDERYERTIDAYAEVRDQYGEALIEFQRQQADTTSVAFGEARDALWEIEGVMDQMKWELSDMLNTKTQNEAADYELRIRTQR